MVKGIVYEIKCVTTGDTYIGSTTKTLEQRLSNHKYDMKDINKYPSSKLYKAMREHGVDNFTIEPLFIKTVEKDYQLRKFEGNVIRDRQPTLNTLATGLHFNDIGEFNQKLYSAEYRKNNKDIISMRKSEYYKKNKDRIAEYFKKKTTCVCDSVIVKVYLPQHLKTNKHKTIMSDKLNTPQRCRYPDFF